MNIKLSQKMCNRFYLLILMILCNISCFGFTEIELVDLQVNYEKTPLGIDDEQPMFSWRMETQTGLYNVNQKSYQIKVVSENGAVVWDSGEVDSDRSLTISYKGAGLEPTTRYYWTVLVETNKGHSAEKTSWFETGFMNPDPQLSAWDGANWIGGDDDDQVFHAHYLSVFKLEYTMQIDKESASHRAAFVFGANDIRLMRKDLNLNQVEVGKDKSYVAVELDISGVNHGEKANLFVYRVGYTSEDRTDQPLYSLDIPVELINQNNQYAPHTFYIQAVFGNIEIYLDGVDQKNLLTKSEGSGFGNRGINLNPYGNGGDFICFPMLADIGFKVPLAQKANFSNIIVRHYRKPSNPIFIDEISHNSTGLFANMDGIEVDDQSYFVGDNESETLIIVDPSRNSTPMLRSEFKLRDKAISKARIYVTARGIYELYLNGERISQDYFNPGLTQYNKHHLYQTYDVTDHLDPGDQNALGVWLSEGWWSGNITFRGENWNFFGDRQSVLLKMVVTYDDGTKDLVVSDPQNWKIFTGGPVEYGSFFQGEKYNALKNENIGGWSMKGFNDEDWESASTVSLRENAITNTFHDFLGRPVSLSYDDQKIIGQIGGNVTIVDTLQAISMSEVRPGVFVYDMGQNMVGVPKISLNDGEAGDTVILRYAEFTYPELTEYEGNYGMVMMENIRAALTQDMYIRRGKGDIIQPRFTFHGFRYIEVTGVNEPPPLDAVRGLVLSSVKNLTSKFVTSNQLVNKLWENITWSLRANFLSIPTDTPARNERMGWNGDINVFSRAATWLADVNQFMKRHLMAMRDMQNENGRFSDVAPIGNGFGGTLWGSAGIVVPWETYQQFGDKELLEEHYPAMKAYVAYLESRQNNDGILTEGPLGDWLSPENAKNDNTLLWTAYQVYNLEIMKKVALILGHNLDASVFEKKYKERKDFFNSVYVDKEHHKTIHSGAIVMSFGPPPQNPPKKGDLVDTQASYAIPLAFGVFNDENRKYVVSHLAKAVERKNLDDSGVIRPAYSLMTGFIGTASIGDALSENGLDSIAYRLLLNEQYPSWLYPVKNGATTIWERLNSYTHEAGFGGNNSMNSFNHYAFGAVASWMYNYVLGIQRLPEYPGLKKFILKPTPDPDKKLTFAEGFYDGMYGRIESAWRNVDDQIIYTVGIPPNTSAKLYLKSNINNIINQPAGVIPAEEENHIVFNLGSGSYTFILAH